MQKLSYLLGTLAIAALLGLGYTVLLLNSSIDRFENVVDGLQKLGAPANFIATPATTSPRNFSFTVGTSTPRGIYGTSTLAAYGSTTIQTPIDTLYAFQVFNAATTSVFDIDTINDRASTTALVISGINGSTQCLQIDADGDVTGFGSGCGGAFPFTVHADGVSTSTRLVFGNGFISQASSTVFGGLSVDNGTTTNATSTNLNVSGQVDFDTLTSALILTGAGGLLAEYTGADCTNQFIRDLSALGAPTCATIVGADVDLADLTATDSTLTFSGAYDGQTARTVGINLANPNTWSALQTITHASTTNLTVGTYFGIPYAAAPVITGSATHAAIGVDSSENEFLYATSTNTAAPAVIKPYEWKGFSHASSTQGSGSTTKPFFIAPPNGAGYFDSITCTATSSTATSAFLRVMLSDEAGNRMNDLVASTTENNVKFTANNAFTAGEVINAQIGTTTNIGVFAGVTCFVKVIWTRN